MNGLELAVLILAALLHDFGMFVSEQEKRAALQSPAFDSFLAGHHDRATALTEARAKGEHARAEVIQDTLLAEYFLHTFAKVHKKKHRNMSAGFLAALSRHSWPGNVRELQNVIERSVVLANGHERLGVDDLPPELQSLSVSDDLPTGTFHEAVRGFKRELVRSALTMHGGNKRKAARELGISRCYLHRLLNQLNVMEGVGAAVELQATDGDELPEDGPPENVGPTGIFHESTRIA